MRKFQGRARARALCAGLATAATVVAAVAFTASPAFATDQAVTLTPSPGGQTGGVVAYYPSFLRGVPPTATINTGACTANYQTPTTGIVAATITKNSND